MSRGGAGETYHLVANERSQRACSDSNGFGAADGAGALSFRAASLQHCGPRSSGGAVPKRGVIAWHPIRVPNLLMFAPFFLRLAGAFYNRPATPEFNFEVQHWLANMEAFIRCSVCMSFSGSVVELSSDGIAGLLG